MGPDSDPLAVVDPRLRVRGVRGLRIADGSILPFLPAINPCITTMMIGEKCADMLKEDAQDRAEQVAPPASRLSADGAERAPRRPRSPASCGSTRRSTRSTRAIVERVAAAAEVEFHRAGTTIFSQGAEPVEHLRVVRSGAVEIVHDGRVLDLLGEGELFGHASMLSGLPTGFEARAAEDTLCYRIARRRRARAARRARRGCGSSRARCSSPAAEAATRPRAEAGRRSRRISRSAR